MLRVGIFSHQGRQLGGILNLQLDEPGRRFGRCVDGPGFIGERPVDFHNGPADGSVHVRRGLDRFDRSEGVALFKFVSDFWEVDKDNVSQGGLCKVANADGADISLDLDVFVGYKIVRTRWIL